LDIHLIAIGGTGMAPLACLLRDLGHDVRGSDGPLYPPTSELLADAGIEPLVGYDPAHLSPKPDLVIVGNAVPRTNPEAIATEELGLPRLSMPEALDRFVLRDRRPLVVAGSHGKTTTTAMAAWVYTRAGSDPGYLIGGAPIGLPAGFALGGGPRFAIEGDEYNASYFDRGPKFWHYRPETVILTSLEHDHVDLYPDFEELERAFLGLVERLPASGLLIACADYPAVERLLPASPCRVVTYSAGAGGTETGGMEIGGAGAADIRLVAPVESGENGISFELEEAGERQRIELGVWGEHNALNAMAVWAAARADGLERDAVLEAFATFRGVKRRLELVGEAAGVVVIDDFAHHASEVAASLSALRQRFPGRRLVALFEPRSLSAGRRQFAADLAGALASADRVFLAPVFHRERLGEEGFDPERMAADIERLGADATACASNDELAEKVLAEAKAGDVLVTMSSGSFDDMPRRLQVSLQDLRL
jgi:UDP-N-acetylmuramate: L-alanyl-gamma-D-glutamyl-meso-diaminopimelate ligase